MSLLDKKLLSVLIGSEGEIDGNRTVRYEEHLHRSSFGTTLTLIGKF